MNKHLLISMLCLIISCDDNPTKPPDASLLRDADLRKLRWTADTLYTENSLHTMMYSIWGAAKNDVWVGGYNDNNYGDRWHYDGTTWTADWDNGIPGLTINDMWGFAPDNIWAVGERIWAPGTPAPGNNKRLCLILHYNGTEWQEVSIPNPEGRASVGLSSLGGAGPDNLYAGGANGTLYHYDGNNWTVDSLYLPVVPNDSNGTAISTISRGDKNDEIYLLLQWRKDYAVVPYPYLYKRENNRWVLKDSSNYSYYFNHLWLSPQKNLYLFGSDVVIWSEATGFSSLPNVPTEISYLGIAGWDDNLLITGRTFDGTAGRLFHFNGHQWTRLQSLPELAVYHFEPFFVDDVVFLQSRFVGGYPIKSFIFKGTLPD